MTSRTRPAPNTPKLDGVVRLASVKREDPPPDEHGLYAELQKRISARVTDPAELEQRFLDVLQPRLGRASFELLKPYVHSARRWAVRNYEPSRGPRRPWILLALRQSYTKKLLEKIGLKRLRREWRDELLRDRAARGPEQVLEYFAHVARRLVTIIHVFKRQWYVPNMTVDELIKTAQVELLAGLRTNGLRDFERPGQEATIRFCLKLKKRLAARHDVYEVLPPSAFEIDRTNFEDDDESDPGPETKLARKELKEALPAVFRRVEARLSRIQKKHYDAIRADVMTHGELNLQRVADALGRHRSSPTRAHHYIVDLLRAELREHLS